MLMAKRKVIFPNEKTNLKLDNEKARIVGNINKFVLEMHLNESKNCAAMFIEMLVKIISQSLIPFVSLSSNFSLLSM